MIASQPARPRLVARNGARSDGEALHEEIERLRAYVETRAQAQEDRMRALALEGAMRAAEALEERIQLASREAIAFAEQGLEQHEAALRALGRRVAELSRETRPFLDFGERPVAAAPAVAGLYQIGAGAGSAECRPLGLRRESEDVFYADLANLPILPGGAAKLVAAHVVEFVATSALVERILPHWRSRLAPGGELVVVTLDGPAWLASLARGGDFGALRKRLGADGASQPVRNLFDASGLCEALKAAGFAAVAATAAEPLELRVVARAAAT